MATPSTDDVAHVDVTEMLADCTVQLGSGIKSETITSIHVLHQQLRHNITMCMQCPGIKVTGLETWGQLFKTSLA